MTLDLFFQPELIDVEVKKIIFNTADGNCYVADTGKGCDVLE